MMFCPNCGKQIAENSKFCTSCGTAVSSAENIQSLTAPAAVNSKQTELNELQNAKRYLMVVTPYHIKRNEYYANIARLNRLISRSIGGFIGLGIGMAVLAVISLIYAVNGLSADGFFSGMAHAVGGIALVIGLTAATFSVLSFAYFIPKRKKEAVKMRGEVEDLTAQVEQINREIDELHTRSSVKQDLAFYQKLFPQNDFLLEDVEFLINLMTSNRADSLKEALNLFDEHQHRQKIEQLSHEQAVYAQQTAESAKRTAWTVQEINRKL